jgi:hypothetical protein
LKAAHRCASSADNNDGVGHEFLQMTKRKMPR